MLARRNALRPLRVQTGKARYEHMFSALPLKADITLRTRYVRFVPEAAVRSAALLTHSRLSTIEVPVHLRSPGVMAPVQASAEPQPVPPRPCRAAPSRRSRTQGQEAAATPLSHRECAGLRSARCQEVG